MAKKKLFKKGAWLRSNIPEIPERQFIQMAGGVDKVMEFRHFPFVTLVMHDPDPKRWYLVGHTNGRAIALNMEGLDHWITMEWNLTTFWNGT